MSYLPQGQLAKYREENKPLCCPILGIKTDDWVLDHDHQTGFVRGVISRQANSLLGKVEKFYFNMCSGDKEFLPVTLEAMAAYLEMSNTSLLHPVGFRQLYRRFSKLTKQKQVDTLLELGVNNELIADCKNSKDRTEIYKERIKNV